MPAPLLSKTALLCLMCVIYRILALSSPRSNGVLTNRTAQSPVSDKDTLSFTVPIVARFSRASACRSTGRGRSMDWRTHWLRLPSVRTVPRTWRKRSLACAALSKFISKAGKTTGCQSPRAASAKWKRSDKIEALGSSPALAAKTLRRRKHCSIA
jgi:hypothetical protein